jgi:hypothetical protein
MAMARGVGRSRYSGQRSCGWAARGKREQHAARSWPRTCIDAADSPALTTCPLAAYFCAGALAALAALLLLWVPPLAGAQIITALYACDDAKWAQCDVEFKTCSSLRQAREQPDMGCKCFTDAYVCYADCGRFPADFRSRCSQACPPSACYPASAG